MFHSGEIRWFFDGQPSTEFNQWFDESGMAKHEGERLDEYLLLPDCHCTGVKIREGKFEVKSQTSISEPKRYASNAEGYRDAWVKWSRKVGSSDQLRSLVLSNESPDTWIFVKKVRSLRLISLDASKPEEINPGPFLDQGCQVERTLLKALRVADNVRPSDQDWVNAKQYWSFSFEAFGPAAQVMNNLDQVADIILSGQKYLDFSLDQSMSYPAWIQTIA